MPNRDNYTPIKLVEISPNEDSLKTPVKIEEITPNDDLLRTPVALGPINSDVTKTPVLCTVDDNYELNRNLSTPVALANLELTATPIEGCRQFFNTPIASGEEVIDQSDLKSDHNVANAKSDILSHAVAANLDQVNGSTATIQDSPEVILVKQDLEDSNRVNEPPASFSKPQTWSRNHKITAAALLFFLIAAAATGIILSQTLKSSNNNPAAISPVLPKSQNLIVNGDFSTPACNGNPSCYYSDSSLMSPWTVVSTYKTYEYIVAGYFNFPYRSMDLNSNTSDSQMIIQQTVPTKVGNVYQFGFSLQKNPDCFGDEIKTGFVIATGGLNQTFSISETITQQISYIFRATDSQSAVQIGSTTYGTTCGPVIFNVTMFAV